VLCPSVSLSESLEVGSRTHVLHNTAKSKGKKRTSLYGATVLQLLSGGVVQVRFDSSAMPAKPVNVPLKSCYDVPTTAVTPLSVRASGPAVGDVVLVLVRPPMPDSDRVGDCYAVACLSDVSELALAFVSVVYFDPLRASPERVKLADIVPVAPAVRATFGQLPLLSPASAAVDSRKRTREQQADGADDGGDDDDDDGGGDDDDLVAAGAGAADGDLDADAAAAAALADRQRAWSPVDTTEEGKAERLARAEEAFKKMIAVRTAAEAKLLEAARERRFVRLRRSVRYVESNETARVLPAQAGAATAAQLDATWRPARVVQLAPVASAKTAREWLGELVVPIDVDVTIEQQRVQDTVSMALWDRTLTPLDVAQSICADYCLPPMFERAIAAQLHQALAAIEAQLEEQFAALRAPSGAFAAAAAAAATAAQLDDFEVLDRVNERGEIQSEFLATLKQLHTIDDVTRREVEHEFRVDVAASAATPHGAAERLGRELSALAAGAAPLHEDLRVIEINFVFGNRQFTDRFEWDVACASNSPDLFAASVGADVGLPRAYVAQLAAQLRRAIAAAHALPATSLNTRTSSPLFGVPVPAPAAAPPRGVALVDDAEMRRRVVRIADPVHLQPWTPYFGPPRLYERKNDDDAVEPGGPRLRRRTTTALK
jgi:hypothetical protein